MCRVARELRRSRATELPAAVCSDLGRSPTIGFRSCRTKSAQLSDQYTCSAMASVHLSSALKALIASPQAQGGVVPAPSKAAATALFEGLASSAQQHGLSAPAWLTLGVRAHDKKTTLPLC
jgi:hypothetical protein